MKVIKEINTVKGYVRILEISDSNSDSPLAADYLTKVSGDEWDILRWWFFDEFKLDEAMNFGRRLLDDPEFLDMALRGEAAWKQIQDLYYEAEMKITDEFISKGLFDYSPSDYEGEMRAKWAKDELWSLYSESYFAISKVIGDFGLPGEELEPYLNKQLEAASSTAAMISGSNNIPVEKVRSRHRWLEFRGDEPARWVTNDSDHDDRVRIADLYQGDYGPVVALAVPYELRKFIMNNFEWSETHRSWNDELGCWTMDMDAINTIIDTFKKNDFIVRIWDPVVQILDIVKPTRPSDLRPEQSLPTMGLEGDIDPISASSWFAIPGLTPSHAKILLENGFQGIPDIADSPVTAIAECEGLSISMACVIKDGALAVVGKQEPAAVQIASETPLSLSEAKREIEGLASSGVPPSQVVDAFVHMCQSNIFDFRSINNRDLYYLYDAGFRSVEQILKASVDELADTYLISQSQAKAIREEARDCIENQ